ncbi:MULTISPECIES: hypothetical protein [unclassified Aureispira]|uniref:hypothetical protein n=1 Tax=unclassified Aureispira TaxID=2649989 RepID=UPI0006985386|nr:MULTISPECIES: hypothetical protein [unclassified Aureispira]WMX13415.1 hypothetical protein QP953_21445 [Aureispira sp. CCB-E]
MNNWIEELYMPIYQPIEANKKLYVEAVIYNEVKSQYTEKESEFIKANGLETLYSSLTELRLHWKHRDKREIQGTFHFYPVNRLMINWDEDFGGHDWAPNMKGFRPLDMFYESNGCVGFFVDRPDKTGLYLHAFESNVEPLNVDLEGYLKLLIVSKGFSWWQIVLVSHIKGTHEAGLTQFRESMPELFSNFDFDKFIELYESVRIDKK